MSLADDITPDFPSDDSLAAEYVLGVLPARERQAVARRIENEPAFARLIDHWEVRLSPLNASYDEIEPPASLKATLDTRLSGHRQQPSGTTRLLQSIAFWRGLAAAALIAVLVALVVPYMNPPVKAPQPKLIASLAIDGSDVKYLAVYDAGRQDVSLSHVSGERAPGKDFELWMIEGKNPPVSMGIIPPGTVAHMSVSLDVHKKLAQDAVLAVSVEPAGGSPTGQPTGPVVAAGNLRNI